MENKLGGSPGTRNLVMGERKHLILVDGSGYIFRAYHALPTMTRPDGVPINAVYGFTSMLMKLIEDSKSDLLAVIFDAPGDTFRNDIYSNYKANRPPPPEDLVPQFNLIRDAVSALGVPQEELQGYEADDLIATYAKAAASDGYAVTIVSSDKDLMQLVDDKIQMLDPIKNSRISIAEVKKRFGVCPDKVVDVQALAGDSVDNVPGVPGIGIKTAAQLITEYGSLDSLLEKAEQIKQPKRRQNLIEFSEQAIISRELVTLNDNVPVKTTYADFYLNEPNRQSLLKFLREQGFKSILSKVDPDQQTEEFADKKNIGMTSLQDRRKANYALIQDEKLLQIWVEAAEKQGIVSVDTETDSLNSLEANLVGISLSLDKPVEGCYACYIPLAHVLGPPQSDLDLETKSQAPAGAVLTQIRIDSALKIIQPMLSDPGVLKILHNAKYDLEVFSRYGLTLAPVDDTMLLSYVLSGGLHNHGMDELARIVLDRTTIKYKDITGIGKKKIKFAEVPIEIALAYAAEDADITLELYKSLKPRLIKERLNTVYERIERPLIKVLQAMETHGILVDAKELRRLSSDFEKRIASLGQTIYEIAGREFNIGSPKQLGEVLFDELTLPGGKRGKTGAYGTGAEVLEALAVQGHTLPKKILDWRQLSKLKSTYTDALVRDINPNTGRVHTSYSQAVTSTGRLSSNDPNLQNIPIRTEEGRKIRKAFVADDGHWLLSADYSQIELRLMAHVADIPALKLAFENGIDIHASTACEVFDLKQADLDATTRNRAKAINFGIIYGISPFGLARQLAISQKEAKNYIDTYFRRYPGVKDYMEKTKELAHERGFVETVFGRRIYVPGINDKNPAKRGFYERAAINAPLQGTAADIIKRAMNRMPNALKNAELSGRMILQVHDELIFEVPKCELEASIHCVRNVMESAAQLSIPLICDTGFGKSWADAH